MKKSIISVIGIIIILGFVGASCNENSSNNSASQAVENVQSTESSTSGNVATNSDYFSEDAKVMYFYSDYCSWCVKQKEVLAELAPEGYKVKAMDVGANQNYWQEYSVEGTPTFIAPDGTKLVGFQDKETIKKFLDSYK